MVKLEIEKALKEKIDTTPKTLKLKLVEDNEGNILLQTKDQYNVLKITTNGTVVIWTGKLGADQVRCDYSELASDYWRKVYNIELD